MRRVFGKTVKRIFDPRQLLIANKKKQVDIIMREIQVAENKTLKLTNVLARKIDASELGNLGDPDPDAELYQEPQRHAGWPCDQCVKFTSGPNPEPQIYFMMQVNQLIPAWSRATSRTLCCG